VDFCRIPEVNQLITERVQRALPKMLCAFTGLLPNPPFVGFVTVGHARIIIMLRDVMNKEKKSTGRHTISVQSDHTPLKVYKETKSGWFSFDAIIGDVIRRVNVELLEWETAERERILLASAHSLCQQLRKNHSLDRDPQISIGPMQTNGTLWIQTRDLTYDEANKIIAFVKAMNLGKQEVLDPKSLWDLLQDE
jgi:hypothetical protein